MNEIISKLDRLRSAYGKALTAYEHAKKHYGEVAISHRERELEQARQVLAEAERKALDGWKR